jgi:hypothetical protein
MTERDKFIKSVQRERMEGTDTHHPPDPLSSNQHFNALSPVELELLSLLAEECGEVVQIIGKILRHGLHSYHPTSEQINSYTLEREMGDVRAAMILLCEAGITRKSMVHQCADAKLRRITQYLHHARVPEALKHPAPADETKAAP